MAATENERSEWHDALNTFGRMNMVFQLCNQASLELDAITWFHSLRVLRRELDSDMKSNKVVDQRAMAKELINKIDKQLPLHVQQVDTGNRAIPMELYDLLDELEILLRTVHDQAGYKTKRADDPRFAN